MMDGREGQSALGNGMSIRSKLSRNLSIKSRNTSLVQYGRKQLGSTTGTDSAAVQNAGALQRVAVQLRQKMEYGRAEKLMIKAIQVKKQLAGSEISEDIAYLYNELAVTYHGNDDLTSAVKCVRK